MSDAFSTTVRKTIVAAKDYAFRLSVLPEDAHRRLCEALAPRVVAVFEEASAASEGFLRFHRKRDANGVPKIYGLSVQRDAYAITCPLRAHRRHTSADLVAAA